MGWTFIIYAREDEEQARRLYADLRRLGAEPWLDKEDLLPGEEWEAKIHRAIEESSSIVALISRHSVNKRGFVQKELRLALKILAEMPPGRIFLIPCRLDDSRPSHERLRKLHWVDLFRSYDAGLSRIALSLGLSPERRPAERRNLRAALETEHTVAELLLETKTAFALSLVRSLGQLEPDRFVASGFMRRGRDPVIGSGQHLPTCLLIESRDYDSVLRDIFTFYESGPKTNPERVDLIRSAAARFLEIDSSVVRFSATHELVRCLLFMAMPGEDADFVAYRHAQEALQATERLREHEDLEREFHYLICWVLRRMRDYTEAKDWADRGVARWQGDARFHHARSLATMSWLTDVARPAEPEEGLTMENAILDAEEAVRLYRRMSAERFKVQTVACLNNIAYLSSYDPSEATFDLVRARQAVEQMKSLVPKRQWAPDYAEYLHTEASVEYGEAVYSSHWKREAGEGRKAKLRSALRDVEEGLESYASEQFQRLREQIVVELEMMT